MNLLGLKTLLHKETLRFSKVYLQTLLAPMMTTLLYLLVFSHVLEGRLEVFEGVSYTAFLIPGLMMMAVIQNAFANSSSSLIQSRVTGNIIFFLVTPLSYLEIYLAFVLAAILRGLLVGTGVFVVAIFFTDLNVHSPVYIILFALLGSAVLGTLGIVAGIWAEKFDQLSGFTNFIIMPLSFLSGVFYSIHSLPEVWQKISHFNPFFYMIDGFRYGFFGQSDVNPLFSLTVVSVALLSLAGGTLVMLDRGYKLRN
jgi:ABC-2 type transport system permease protein